MDFNIASDRYILYCMQDDVLEQLPEIMLQECTLVVGGGTKHFDEMSKKSSVNALE